MKDQAKLNNFRLKPLAIALGTGLAVGVAAIPLAHAESNPFSVTPLSSGYNLAAHDSMDTMTNSVGEGMNSAKEHVEDGMDSAKESVEDGMDSAKDSVDDGMGSIEDDMDDTMKGHDGKCGEGKCGANKKAVDDMVNET